MEAYKRGLGGFKRRKGGKTFQRNEALLSISVDGFHCQGSLMLLFSLKLVVCIWRRCSHPRGRRLDLEVKTKEEAMPHSIGSEMEKDGEMWKTLVKQYFDG